MATLLIYYPKCTTCQRAKKWLEDRGFPFDSRHILEETPTAQELRQWATKGGLPVKRFFNTSGLLYREQGLKDKLPAMSEEEQFALLATSGMLIKRPVLVGDDFVLVGFRPQEWERALGGLQ